MRRTGHAIQPLEARLFLAGQFPVAINFQPAAAPIPSGYLADTGGTPTSGNRFFDSTVRVNVNDGYLTISNAAGSCNNKIAFVEIKIAPTSPPSPPPPPPSPPPPPPPPGQTPFGAVPRIGGLIEAENFDNGGSGLAGSDVP